VEALDLRSGQRTRPDGHRRTLLELADTGEHSLGHAAEQVPRRELLTDGLGGRLHLAQVRRREEKEREVDLVPAAPAAASRTRRLRRGLPGRLRGRQTGPDPTRKRLGLHRGPVYAGADATPDIAPAPPGVRSPWLLLVPLLLLDVLPTDVVNATDRRLASDSGEGQLGPGVAALAGHGERPNALRRAATPLTGMWDIALRHNSTTTSS